LINAKLMLEMTLDYVSPLELTSSMLESGAKKAKLSVSDLLIRGVLAGAFLGMAATLSDAAIVASSSLPC
jgi:formate/nitrite transporter FocA (FNT family)